MSAAALLKLSRALHGVRTLEDLLDRVRTAVTESTRYNRAYVHLLHPDARIFEIVGWVLPDMQLVRQRLKTIDASRDALLQRVHTATEPFVITDMRLDPDADQRQVEFFGNRTAICVPMFDGDHQIGPLVVPTYADQGVFTWPGARNAAHRPGSAFGFGVRNDSGVAAEPRAARARDGSRARLNRWRPQPARARVSQLGRERARCIAQSGQDHHRGAVTDRRRRVRSHARARARTLSRHFGLGRRRWYVSRNSGAYLRALLLDQGHGSRHGIGTCRRGR